MKIDGKARDRAESLAPRVLRWFDGRKRDLPWRRDRDPYRVWVSEIMLQQTQVHAVIPYFERFMRAFPNVATLADAPLDEVLRLWAGLGYYSRARNLHRAARMIVERHGGRFPDTFGEIVALPGIGAYTAGAIASIAFGERVPAIDGNATRVLARLFLLKGDVRAGRGKRRIHDLGHAAVSADRPGDYNQSLMELGSLICLAKQPRCGQCCLADICGAHREGKQNQVPQARARPRTRIVRTVAAIVERGGRLLIAQRPAEGVWGGLWEFPNAELKRGQSPRQVVVDLLRDAFGLEVEVGEVVARIRHGIMNQRIQLTAYACAVRRGRTKATRHVTAKWVRPEELEEYALPAPHRRIAEEVTGPDRAERGSRCRPRLQGGGQA